MYDDDGQRQQGKSSDGCPEQEATVSRQRDALRRGRRGDRFQHRMTARLQKRREEGGAEVEQFDVVRDGSPGGTAILRGSLLIRASLATDDADLFAELTAEVGPPTAHLDERLLVLTGKLPAQRLVDLSRKVRARGHEASVDHIVPLGVIVKGEGGPAIALVGAPRADPARDPQGIGVALIDTGAAGKGREHVWQAGLDNQRNEDPLDAFPSPGGDGLLDAAAGHGAFATGLVQQVNPGGQPSIYRAIDSDGIGSEVRVAEALLQAVREDGAEVVNLSLGAQTLDDQPLLALQVAFELLSEAGRDDALLVAAAGNYGDTRPCWPAAFRRVVAVAGLTAEMQPTGWSSRGHWVDVSTVGEGLVSTYVRGEESPDLSPGTGTDVWPLTDDRPWAVWTGTSFAAPQVAGEVARRLAAARASGDTSATPRSVFTALLSEGTRVPDFGVAVKILPGTSVPD